MDIRKETLAIARNLMEKDPSLTDWIVSKFPELKESEDEKVRKGLIEYFNHHRVGIFCGIKGEDILSWLEEKGGQKPIISDDALREGIAHFGITQYQIDNWLKKYVNAEQQGESIDKIAKEVTKDKASAMTFLKKAGIMNENGELAEQYRQDEQIPTWSEEDSPYYDDICEILINILHSETADVNKDAIQKDLDWLKLLKDRVQPLPKQEWSKKDEAYLDDAFIACLNEYGTDSDNAMWLKSLKNRYTWKPSDKQMKSLKEACDQHWEPYGLDPLYTLYQDLKKLK